MSFLIGFLCAYPALYAWGSALGAAGAPFGASLVVAVGTGWLGFAEVPVQVTGSGDTAFEVSRVALCLLASLVVASAVALARPRPEVSARAALWGEALVRYYLAWELLGYGVVKLACRQFQGMDLEGLWMPLGEASPMGFMWRFMGYSPGYQQFAGAIEVAAALLLVWRPTATLGAAVAAGVMTNVLALDLAFDVPVRLHASHLLIFALGLVWRDRQRVLGVLVLNRAVPARDLPPYFERRGLHLAGRVAKAGAVGGALWISTWGWAFGQPVPSHDPRWGPELRGVWDIVRMEVEGEGVDLGVGGARSLRRLVLDVREEGTFLDSDGQGWGFAMVPGQGDGPWFVRDLYPAEGEDPAPREWQVRRVEGEGDTPAQLHVSGQLGYEDVALVLERRPPPVLTGTPTRWIQEWPDNR